MTRDDPQRQLKYNQQTLACQVQPGQVQPGKAPGVMFLGGFGSDMTGSKASYLSEFCRQRDQAYVRFDYTGHGQSSGRFIDGTIGQWLDDATEVFDRLTTGPQILVGSSMGGWLMVLLALRRPTRVAGLVGVAAAPDFTEELIWQTLPPEDRRRLVTEGVIYSPSDYGPEPTPYTLRLIEEGRRHLVLTKPIPFTGPVRLLHGLQDRDVPWQMSQRLCGAVESNDVVVTLIKGGDHRLSAPQDLNRLGQAISEITSRLSG